MSAADALRAGCRSLATRPIAAFAGLLPLTPLALIPALGTLISHPAFATACSCANFILLGPAMIGSWRHYLVLVDGPRPSPRDWFAGLPFVLHTLAVNILRIVATLTVIVPTVLAVTIYFMLSGSGLSTGGDPSPMDLAVFVLLTTPAAAAVVSVKCLTYPFEILLADGRSGGLWPSLDASIRLAWSNIRPIAWIFTTIALAAIPLFALACFALPHLPHGAVTSNIVARGPLADSMSRLQAFGQAAKISLMPMLPWIFLVLAHAHRQVMPASERFHVAQPSKESAK